MNTKDKLINATIELVYEYGLTDIPTSKIAKKAGYSEATIYKHFASKVELVIEAYFKIKSDLDKAIFKDTKNINQPFEKVKKVWYNYLDYFLVHPKRLKYYLQFTNSNYMNQVIFERGAEKFESLTHYMIENIKNGFFRDMPLSFYYAFVHIPILEVARAVIDGELELTEDLKEQAFLSTLRSISFSES